MELLFQKYVLLVSLLFLAFPLLFVLLLLLVTLSYWLVLILHLFFVATVLVLAEIPADAACYCWYLGAVVFVSGIYQITLCFLVTRQGSLCVASMYARRKVPV
jgi:hypothetical protein